MPIEDFRPDIRPARSMTGTTQPPAPAPPSAIGSGRRPGQLLAAGGLAVLAVAAAVVALPKFHNHHPAPAAPVAADLLVPVAPGRLKIACIDTSGSTSTNVYVGQQAIHALGQGLAERASYPTGVLPGRPFAAIPGVDLVSRMVAANSYIPAADDTNTVRASVPSVAGVRIRAPQESDDDYDKVHPAYTSATAIVTSQLGRARLATTTGRTKLSRQASIHSAGSDISGCLAALSQLQHVGPVSALVVSDLEDTDVRRLDGDLRAVPITVVQSCGSGNPTTCDAIKAAFIQRMKALGAPAANITFVRPEDVTSAVLDWMRT